MDKMFRPTEWVFRPLYGINGQNVSTHCMESMDNMFRPGRKEIPQMCPLNSHVTSALVTDPDARRQGQEAACVPQGAVGMLARNMSGIVVSELGAFEPALLASGRRSFDEGVLP